MCLKFVLAICGDTRIQLKIRKVGLGGKRGGGGGARALEPTHKDGRTYYKDDGVKAEKWGRGGCGPMAMELERKVEE